MTDRLIGYSLAVFLYRDRSRWVNGGSFLAHRLAGQLEAVRTVQQAVEDGIGQRRLADIVVPMIDRQLTGDQRGSAVMPVLDDFHEVVALWPVERLYAPVVEDQQIGL